MPLKSSAQRKCKYCDKMAKLNLTSGRNKGYYRTCGSKECLSKQYSDSAVNAKKSYLAKGIIINCSHCGKEFIKAGNTNRWCKECVPDAKSRNIMQRYNLNRKEYLALMDNVNGLCPTCLKRPASVVDHNHKTGKVRGFLCNFCNMFLNLVEDGVTLERAKLYLKGSE